MKIYSLLLAATITIIAATSCQKDEALPGYNSKEALLNRLISDDAKYFFDKDYISKHNPHIKQIIQPRGETELLDSLFNYLLLLQISDPYAEELVEQIGFPIWTGAIVHQTNYRQPCISVPAANVTDSMTAGIIMAVLHEGNWYPWYVTRDTLYNFVTATTVSDTNIGVYVAGILSFDHNLFAVLDSIMYEIYTVHHVHFTGNEEPIVPRTADCFLVQQQFTYMGPCDPAPDWVYMYECTEELTDYYSTIFCIESGGGGPSDVGQGFGGGGGGGGSTGGNNGNGNNGGSGISCPCGCTPTLEPFLCMAAYNLNYYGGSFIVAFNNLLPYLGSAQADWLLTMNSASTSYLESLEDFLNNFSTNQTTNGQIINFYISYLMDSRISTYMSLEDFGNLLLPYLPQFNIWERMWLSRNLDILNDANIEDFLLMLNNVNATPAQMDVISWAQSFSEEEGYSDASLLFAHDVFTATALYPEIRTDRCEELFDWLQDLESDEEILVPCMPSSQGRPTSFWIEVASFTPPTSVLDHVQSSGYEMQFIDDATNPIVNLDYFSIAIQTMPKKANGQTMTDEEFINYFRLNIGTFTETAWTPITSDNALWTSSDPLGAILNITIPFDDGGVVTSDHDACCWVFSTVKDPGLFNEVGTHPVSGNRQFGMTTENGVKTFFIKGADRSKNLLGQIVGYGPADDFWETTITNVKEFINATAQAGQCSINTPDKNRPNWIQERAKLMSSSPLTNIGCE